MATLKCTIKAGVSPIQPFASGSFGVCCFAFTCIQILAPIIGRSLPVDEAWDPDIAVMALSPVEKNGLQVYRNYNRAFEEHRASAFVAEADKANKPLEPLPDILSFIAAEDVRSLPVLACAFIDDALKEMFRREIPDDTPGGRSELLTGFGPLSNLSQRIKIAYAFGWLSPDILKEVDLLRKIRNDISHNWNVQELDAKLEQLINDRQHPFEQYIGDGVRLPLNFHEGLMIHDKFRVRLIWILGRLHYEAFLWVPALKQLLAPYKVLYKKEPPALLKQVSALCLEKTRVVLSRAGS